MNQTKSHQGIAFPQTVEVPAPLEIHPSVDPELARGLIAAVEYLADNPEKFSFGVPRLLENGVGCIICHAERLSNWRRDRERGYEYSDPKLPLGSYIRIFFKCGAYDANEIEMDYDTVAGRMARIEHFLRTGE